MNLIMRITFNDLGCVDVASGVSDEIKFIANIFVKNKEYGVLKIDVPNSLLQLGGNHLLKLATLYDVLCERIGMNSRWWIATHFVKELDANGLVTIRSCNIIKYDTADREMHLD